MSRRDSRVSVDVRQENAAFNEFKKKFLLANKHITKLNSTLSARIEELNGQISTLLAENVGLRAAKIALEVQLQRERTKTRKLMAETESATAGLMRQLGLLRESFGISEDPASKRSTSPLARKPKRDPEASPPPNRLARAPGFAEIQEEDEEDAGNASPTPSSRPSSLRLKPRRSSSRLSLPQFASTPSPTEEEAPVPEKRKPARRQSALLGSAVAPSSTTTTAPVTTSIHPSVTTRRPRNSVAVRDVVSDVVTDNEVPSPTAEEDEVVEVKPKPARLSKERKREPEMRFEVFGDPVEELTGPPKRGAKSVSRETRAKEGFEFEDPPPSTRKLVDVTNSPRRKLASLDTKRKSDAHRLLTPDSDDEAARIPLKTPVLGLEDSYFPAPRSSESPPTGEQEDEGAEAHGRERRVRKSVNYAEPKLNTKMRKPRDEALDTPAPGRRRSTTTTKSRVHEAPWSRVGADVELNEEEIGQTDADEEAWAAAITALPPAVGKRKRGSSTLSSASAATSVRQYHEEEDLSDTDSQVDGEYIPAPVPPTRRKSAYGGKKEMEGGRRHSIAV